MVLRKYAGSNVGNGSVTNAFGVGEIKCIDPMSTLIGRFPANVIQAFPIGGDVQYFKQVET